ncbi:PREDICTED: putative lipid-transfer protein DIR1 [Lupinus angustifolius]|uniref:putative lipid-transfer protein DIR1 n=1 Tax=Lupinus angustifolius TaxID=3871 RepID=UPI00092F0B72|nr:PREDICTED: putative lipid-transfer protein DIR1 [Lupinus angustifolius]
MVKTNGNVLVQWLVTALLVALLGGAKAVVLCNIDSTKLNLCYAAVTGTHPPKPNGKCCEVVLHADLPCLCGYKSILPALGINPTNAFTLPKRCGLKTPPQCRVN